MFTLFRENGGLRVSTSIYTLTWAPDRPFVYFDNAQGKRLAELFVLSSVHTTLGQDDTVWCGAWEIQEQNDSIILTLAAKSSVWKAKTYVFECFDDRFRYKIILEGNGCITDANYFGGYFSGQLRWGSGFFWSGQEFEQGFNPEPVSSEIYTFPASGGSVIDLTGVPLPARADWFFTPPPFCYAFQTSGGWLGMGVEGMPGENRFTEYHYHGQRGAFYLSLAYEGHTRVDGMYTLPAVGFDFATLPYHVLEQHTAALIRHGCTTLPPDMPKPEWWRSPIYCGWGEQCYTAKLEKGHAPDYARQDLYETFLAVLAQHGVHPGVIVLDDKWQATYGDNRVDPIKWPDLTGFIERQHAAGRKVLLWLKAWDPEGIPPEECITNAAGLPIAVDPTHPAFEQRMREAIRVMLIDYDADGFKVDFTARIPSGPGIRLNGDVWGLELMKAYLKILHDEAKRVKPDALIMTHTPHTYLADVVDMIRLNDINIGTDVNCAMEHRARVASSACPSLLIDTDNWPIMDRETWRHYVQIQPELGVPSLYFATHIDRTGEPLTDDDYQMIRDMWKRYAENTLPKIERYKEK